MIADKSPERETRRAGTGRRIRTCLRGTRFSAPCNQINCRQVARLFTAIQSAPARPSERRARVSSMPVLAEAGMPHAAGGPKGGGGAAAV